MASCMTRGGTSKLMKLHAKCFIFGLLSGLWPNLVIAEELGNWSIAQSTAPDGTTMFKASLSASNLITAGSGPDYAPIYSIGCKQGDVLHWRQTLQLEDGVSGNGQIELAAKIDEKARREEVWMIGENNKPLTRENTPDIAELRSAHHLKLSWNWGWSWMWLSDKAKFQLGDVKAVIFTLAKSCGIAEP